MTVKLLIEHPLEFLSLKGGCTGSSESSLVKMPHCWKSHVVAHILTNSSAITMFRLYNLHTQDVRGVEGKTFCKVLMK